MPGIRELSRLSRNFCHGIFEGDFSGLVARAAANEMKCEERWDFEDCRHLHPRCRARHGAVRCCLPDQLSDRRSRDRSPGKFLRTIKTGSKIERKPDSQALRDAHPIRSKRLRLVCPRSCGCVPIFPEILFPAVQYLNCGKSPLEIVLRPWFYLCGCGTGATRQGWP